MNQISLCTTNPKYLKKMSKALVIIDLQNDITKNYRDIIGNVNRAVDWAVAGDVAVVYIRHENLLPLTRTFKPGTRGAELVADLKVVSENIYTKTKGNALTASDFADFISTNGIDEFFIAGADAVACVKSTCYNMTRAGYKVNVLSDCVTSYDKRKLDGMLRYYEKKGCTMLTVSDLQ